MLERNQMERGIFEIVDTENLVPADHLSRKIDAAIAWDKLYDMVEPLYCEDNGLPGVDPFVLFKMVLIQHLCGIPSFRWTAEEVRAISTAVGSWDTEFRRKRCTFLPLAILSSTASTLRP